MLKRAALPALSAVAVVADGDGVVVVPRQYVDKVAEIAWDIAKGDKAGRLKPYERMCMQPDSTVK